MEDKETCTTEIFLANDGSVDVSIIQTDGPLPVAASGTWEERQESGGDDGREGKEGEEDSQPFRMTIARTFEPGVGVFSDGSSFTVERTFRGTMSQVGECVSISGSMYILDDTRDDTQVGYFSMIDTTDAKDLTEEE